MAYLKAPKGAVTGSCIFCDKLREPLSKDRENLLLLRGAHAMLLLNLYPYSNGHLLVAPNEHCGDLEKLDGETLKEMMLLVARGIHVLRQSMAPQGFNVGANLGRVAGAGVEDHIHFHLVPRWNGDTNFMPVLADTRIIPELLPQTYDNLLALLQEEEKTSKSGAQ